MDEAKYLPALERLADGGALANARAMVTLAERGHTQTVGKLLPLLLENADQAEDRVHWKILEQRIQVLFSNSTDGATNGMTISDLASYWADQGKEVTLRDPWRDHWDACFCE